MVDYSIFTNEEEIPGEGIVLKRARAKVQSPGGVLSNTVKPEGGAMLPNARRTRLKQLQEQAAALEGLQPDFSQLQAFAKQQGEQGQTAMLNALAAQYAGESFQPLQTQFLRRAAAAQEPMKIGGGMLTPDGQFMRDPVAARTQELARLDRLIGAEQDDISAEERTAQARIDRLERDRQMIEQKELDRELRRSLAETVRANRQGSQAGTFSQSGFTPTGQQVVTNSKSGVSYLLTVQPDGTPNYTPYQGPMIPKGSFDKDVAAVADLAGVSARADKLIEQVESNPTAFGLRSAAVAAVPGSLQGYAAKAVGLTPQQLEARSLVLRQAAQEINELYGAALSMGEQARANTFLPNPADPPEMLLSKLKAARDWAKTQTSRYGPGVNAAALARSGGAPAQPPAGGLSAEEQAELQRLREKHRRGQ